MFSGGFLIFQMLEKVLILQVFGDIPYGKVMPGKFQKSHSRGYLVVTQRC